MKASSARVKWLRVLQDSLLFTQARIQPLALYAAFSLLIWLAYWLGVFEILYSPLDQAGFSAPMPLINFLALFVGMVLASVIQCGFLFFIDALSHDDPCRPWQAMGRIMPRLVHYICVQLLAGILVLLGLLLFIIPGLYVYAKLILSDYLVVLKEKKGLGQAISASWRTTRGAAFQIVILVLIGLAFAVLMIVALGMLMGVHGIPEPSFLQTLPSEIGSWLLVFFWAIIRYRFYLLLGYGNGRG